MGNTNSSNVDREQFHQTDKNPFLKVEYSSADAKKKLKDHVVQLKKLILTWSDDSRIDDKNIKDNESIFEEILSSRKENYYSNIEKYLKNHSEINSDVNTINSFQEIVKLLDGYLENVGNQIYSTAENSENKMVGDVNRCNQLSQHWEDKENNCFLVITRLCILNSFLKTISKMKKKPSDASSRFTFLLSRCKLKKLIFLALSCKLDQDELENLDDLEIKENNILENIKTTVCGFDSYIDSLGEFNYRFSILMQISGINEQCFNDFQSEIQNVEVQKSLLDFPVFRIDLEFNEEQDKNYREKYGVSNSILKNWTMQSEAFFIYYLKGSENGREPSKLTILTYFHPEWIHRTIYDREENNYKKNHYGVSLILAKLKKDSII
tara:strand:+ start:1451 stop:2590 length:1140 start_codon:yes stop_codon:yes gene_type:complete